MEYISCDTLARQDGVVTSGVAHVHRRCRNVFGYTNGTNLEPALVFWRRQCQ